MSKITKSQVADLLDQKYPLLGDLTQSEFIALKYHLSKDKQIAVVHKIDIDSVVIQNEMKGWDRAAINNVKPHDTIRINLTVNRNGQLQTGTCVIEDIKAAQYNPQTGYTMIETDSKAITDQPDIRRDFELFIQQMEQNSDVRILGQLIANGQVDLMLVGGDDFKKNILYGDIEFSDIQAMSERAHQAQNRIADMMLGGMTPTHQGLTNSWDQRTRIADKEKEEEERKQFDLLNRIQSETAELNFL